MDTAIDALEKRISALELQILPKDKVINLQSQSIVDYLLETQEMITTALSCREAVANILRRLPMINEYLNPNCDNEDVAEVRQYVLDLYPELKRIVSLLKEYFALKPALDVDRYVTQELTDKVSKLNVDATDAYGESEQTKEEVREILKALQEMTYSYKALFTQLEYSMALIEESAKPKEVIDD